MSQVEDWSDGDFDLEHTELRTDHLALQDVHSHTDVHPEPDSQLDWDQSFPEETVDDASDEQTDTIKLSTAASSALKRMLEASKASASPAQPFATDDLDPELRPPALDLARISQFVVARQELREDAHACSSASFSTSASTSSRSMMGLSTDLTDPDSPHSKNSTRDISSRSSHNSDRARSDRGHQSSELEDALEMDFDLAPEMNNLSLCSSLSRSRSHASLNNVVRDIWDDEPAASAPSSNTAPDSSLSLYPTLFAPHPPSVKSMSGESDADDEHDDVLEGLDLEGSIFDAQSGSTTQPAPFVKARLEAILELKRSGQQASTEQGPSQATDPDTGIAAGLVITDDFDISSSRIAARTLSTKSNLRSNGQGTSCKASIEMHQGDEPYHHPPRTASQHSPHIPVSDSGQTQPTIARPEVRGTGRNRLRFKRSASDLQAHVSKATSNAVSTASDRSLNRGSQLTRKRSLPSLRTSPPAASSSTVTAGPSSTLAVRQRHNSGNSTASSSSRFRPRGPSRLTDSTAASRARAAETAADQLARMQRDMSAPARPSTPVSFPFRSTHQTASRISVDTRSKAKAHQERRVPSAESQAVPRLLKRSAHYGTGAELDGIDDLPNMASPVARPSRPTATSDTSTVADIKALAPKRGTLSKRGGRRAPKGKPALIRSLGAGASPAHKTVKGMRWNAQALRWEGNEDVLRDFDQVIQSSTRPALISQLTGSSTSSALTHAAGYSSPLSPESSTLMSHLTSGARVVGDMLFDPVQMRWIHKSGDEEEDVFAQFDESLEDGDGLCEASSLKLGVAGDDTLRARRTRSTEVFSRSSNPWIRVSDKHDSGSSVMDDDAQGRNNCRKNNQAIRRALSRNAFASSVGIDHELWDACVQAEKRHVIEIEGWLPPSAPSSMRGRTRSHASDRAMTMSEIDCPRPHLYYLEKIAKSIVRPDHGP